MDWLKYTRTFIKMLWLVLKEKVKQREGVLSSEMGELMGDDVWARVLAQGRRSFQSAS